MLVSPHDVSADNAIAKEIEPPVTRLLVNLIDRTVLVSVAHGDPPTTTIHLTRLFT